MRTLIVAKTKMYSDACVGAITTDKQSIRLLMADGLHQPRDTPFNIGQVWEINYQKPPPKEVIPPHIEDVWVKTQHFERQNTDLRSTILKTITPWTGDASRLFGGLLQFSSSGSSHIEHASGIPDRSTWFWVLDDPLYLEFEYYKYRKKHQKLKIKYVGFEQPPDILPKGTLVRVSLARWWERNPGEPDRCYLQLSGWY